MAVQDDVAAAREAIRALKRATVALVRHHGDSVDTRRLIVAVDRVAEDLDLLVGNDAASTPAAPPKLQVIDDSAYPQDFWMDAEDEGLGGGR
ncbi:MAG: hypothetical protein JWQ93_1668 [Marmoricola sp.]|jgi:hypothetical protein|nr:hypothetical protein [Marmoricola sp.]